MQERKKNWDNKSWVAGAWVGGWVEKVEEFASLILVSSAISVFCLYSPSHMNFIFRHKTQRIAPFHKRASRNQRRKYDTNIQRKWQELGSALSPPSIAVPLPRTRLSSRRREVCQAQVETFHRHLLQEVGSTV